MSTTANTTSTPPGLGKQVYPSIRRQDFVETLHGVQVADPYHWLEDPDADETKKFVEQQNELFANFIAQSKSKEKINARLTALTDFERYGCPTTEGGSIYYWHNTGLQAQSVMYKQKTLDGEAKVFLDPNTFSEDGTVSVNTLSFSESGKYLAYGLSTSGSDWVKIHVKLTADDAVGEVESTPVEWAKFTGIEWTHDDAGFFYSRYPKPNVSHDKAGTETDSNKNSMLCYHKLNTPQDDDVVVFKDDENPDHLFSATVSDDGAYLIITISASCDPTNKLYIAKLGPGGSFQVPEFNKIVDKFDASYSYITNEGPMFYFVTTLNAPKRRVVKFDLESPEKGFVEVIPETNDVLEDAAVHDSDKLVVTYLHDVKNELHLFNLKTEKAIEPVKLPLPVGSIISSSTGKKRDSTIFYSFSSFLSPGKIYRYDFKTNEVSTFRETKVKGFNAEDFEAKQVFYSSKDGTKIPMYIVSRKGIKLDENNPTILYGYGGFNISITPSFSGCKNITFMQHFNGITCVSNIRGGNEYGEEKWYWEGRREKKQNVFDDFQAAAKYLIAEKYTRPQKLAIQGGSNGGLLVGACLNQAPELFGAGVADVGVMDMLRFHKFTIGHAWVSDYGNPDVEEDFKVVLKYSPVHNVQSEKPYPAVLLTTSDHDDRVVPLHSYKLIATMQHVAKNNPNPLLIRIDTKSGHGAGKSTKQRIEESADKFAFLSLVLDAEWHD
ncbi:hypothetical protein HK098_001672 [Nowakowskiella sp. JEL0407]|nr:hypothetical protein HK098_001672 [Nowakowskiella sp. JEL0407]